MARILRALTERRHRTLAGAYKQCLSGPVAERILVDLADFGCLYRTTFVPGDPHMSAMLEGRREVVLRICAMLQLDVKEFGMLMGSLVQQAKGDDDG